MIVTLIIDKYIFMSLSHYVKTFNKLKIEVQKKTLKFSEIKKGRKEKTIKKIKN